MSGKRTRAGVLAGVTAMVIFAVPSSASAAETIGETFIPEDNFSLGYTGIQGESPGDQYAASSAGVITSWSFQASVADVPQGLKLKVARSAGGSDFTIIGESAPKNPVASTLNTYDDVRIPVQAGDVIGLFMGSLDANTFTFRDTGSPYGEFEEFGDFAPGSTDSYLGPFDLQLDVSAQREDDADEDGFGDETQDECPTNASTQATCDPPQTKITKGAPNKTDKTKVKFKFTSDEPGSTFECKVDKKPYKACTSPRKVKRLDEGKHKFKVRAIDEGGTVDPTPAKDKFKVVD